MNQKEMDSKQHTEKLIKDMLYFLESSSDEDDATDENKWKKKMNNQKAISKAMKRFDQQYPIWKVEKIVSNLEDLGSSKTISTCRDKSIWSSDVTANSSGDQEQWDANAIVAKMKQSSNLPQPCSTSNVHIYCNGFDKMSKPPKNEIESTEFSEAIRMIANDKLFSSSDEDGQTDTGFSGNVNSLILPATTTTNGPLTICVASGSPITDICLHTALSMEKAENMASNFTTPNANIPYTMYSPQGMGFNLAYYENIQANFLNSAYNQPTYNLYAPNNMCPYNVLAPPRILPNLNSILTTAAQQYHAILWCSAMAANNAVGEYVLQSDGSDFQERLIYAKTLQQQIFYQYQQQAAALAAALQQLQYVAYRQMEQSVDNCEEALLSTVESIDEIPLE